jgi:predicted transcriptional regulator
MDKELILSLKRQINLGLEESKIFSQNESALLLTFSDAQISYFVHQM